MNDDELLAAWKVGELAVTNCDTCDTETFKITINRSEVIAPGVLAGWSDEFPDKQFIFLMRDQA